MATIIELLDQAREEFCRNFCKYSEHDDDMTDEEIEKSNNKCMEICPFFKEYEQWKRH